MTWRGRWRQYHLAWWWQRGQRVESGHKPSRHVPSQSSPSSASTAWTFGLLLDLACDKPPSATKSTNVRWIPRKQRNKKYTRRDSRSNHLYVWIFGDISTLQAECARLRVEVHVFYLNCQCGSHPVARGASCRGFLLHFPWRKISEQLSKGLSTSNLSFSY
jgi:hypothetical protein